MIIIVIIIVIIIIIIIIIIRPDLPDNCIITIASPEGLYLPWVKKNKIIIIIIIIIIIYAKHANSSSKIEEIISRLNPNSEDYLQD